MKQQLIFSDGDHHISVAQDDIGKHQLERVALVRKWKTTPEQLSEFIERWTAFRTEFSFDKVLLVIDSDKDEMMTFDCLSNLEKEGEIPDWLCPVWIAGCKDGRNWSQMLNAGIYALTRMNPQSDCHVLCASFDAVARPGFGDEYVNCSPELPVPMLGIRCTLPESHTQEMADFVSACSTPDGNSLLVLQQLSSTFEEYFKGVQKFPSEVLPVLKQFCRNTMQIWRLDALLEIGGFDLRCNEWGGQEDLLAFLMIMLRDSFTEFPLFHFGYDDSTVASKKQTYLAETQDEKGHREDQAVLKILRQLRHTYQAVGDPTEIGVPNPMFGFGS